jgi:hypothetical protein
MTTPLSRRGEGRSADQKGTLSGKDRLKGKVCRLFLHESEHVVNVELRIPTVVRRVGRQGVLTKATEACN